MSMRDAEFMTNYDMVKEFHVKFGLEYDGPPRDLEDDMALFRIGFMIEELGEYADASGFTMIAKSLADIHDAIKNNVASFNDRNGPRDPEKQLDSLVDLNYVSDGTAYLHGFDFDEAYERVHHANMAKIRVDKETLEGSVRKSKYDVVKPPGWSPADLTDLTWHTL